MIGSQTTENIEASSTNSFTLDSRLSDKSFPEEHQLWLSAIQILVHSKQLFIVFSIKKIQLKLEDQPLHPYILSYKEALHAIPN